MPARMTADHARAALRLAVTPRWLGGLVLLLLLLAGAILLGRWQWERTQSILAAERAAAAQPIDVVQALGDAADAVPAEAIGRPVTASGTYRADLQAIVANRALDDRPGVWVVTGLPQEDGSVVAVLRGWLPDATDPAGRVPTDPVVVSGILQPDEAFYEGAVSADGTVPAIASTTLERMWDVDVRPGFVVLDEQDPADAPAPAPVPPTIRTSDVPFPLQNFFYAFQWWIFAAFGLVVYLRWLWIESRRETVD